MTAPLKMLLLIAADPRQSPRAAEAVRLAAGVGAWKRVAIDLYLQGAAVHCLDDACDDWPDGSLLREYLPAIVEHGGAIFHDPRNNVGSGSAILPGLSQALTPISPNELAARLPAYDRLMRV